ncbi:MAG: MBL fold metallo-hydrolase [candidate division Zixibacteria bacterium]|nr:MBL fold metallo-hydrolase [candidate division Zixibacteria bacterium]
MRILPLAFDSIGVRSTATFVETDLKILIDPGVSFAPLRYGLPPTQLELQRVEELSEEVYECAQNADILTISHYHYDHYFPEADFYSGKILLIKDPKNNINRSQKGRGKEFLNWIKDTPQLMEFVDGKKFKFRQTEINFSPPFYHGAEGSRLGYVLACSIKYRGKKMIHASDVQGPQVIQTTEWIIQENPDILILSGFPTLLMGWRSSKFGLSQSNKNLIRILTETKVKTIILDHHLVRDLHYSNKIEEVYKKAKSLNKKIITAAEFLGKQPEFLEARRKEFYKEKEKRGR